jgi:hypothetical protein
MNRGLLALLSIVLTAASLLACATAPREGDHVSIHDETALIVWDAEAKVQHFIRRATFDTQAKDFGFLVPTPSRPELDEAHDYTFKMLARATAPTERTVLVVRRRGEHGASAGGPRDGDVQVVETKRVGDYDAAVLLANDAGALQQWLKKHGYASDAALADWLKPYVQKGWFLTAFKIVKDAGGRPAAASAVRMSFKTDKPFFPYREPVRAADKKESPRRVLRVYLLARTRMDATLGNNGTPWPGTTVWAGSMPRDEDKFLLYALKIHDKVKSQSWWLTELEDRSSARPGTDEVYFSPAGDTSPVARTPITHYLFHYEEPPPLLSPPAAFALGALGGMVLLGLLGFALGWRRR